MSTKIALVVGANGQDGAYLSRYLISNGYKVIGTSRDASLCNKENLIKLNIDNDIELISLSPNDYRNVIDVITKVSPSHIYNLSGMTSVGLSYDLPFECINSILNATLNFLEALRFTGCKARYFNAASSECFGNIKNGFANENTIFSPKSPYGVSKSSAFWLVSSYRESYGIFCCSGILGNHESPLRAKRFVTQKIISNAKLIYEGKLNKLVLGNIDIVRDWGWADEYVKAMHLILCAEKPKDYIISTGKSYTLSDFVKKTFDFLGLEVEKYLQIDENLIRPSDIKRSSLSSERIYNELGWKAEFDLKKIIKFMIENKLY